MSEVETLPLHQTLPGSQTGAFRSRLIPWLPVAAALLYPCALTAFHSSVAAQTSSSSGFDWIVAALWLALAFALPLSCLALAMTAGRVPGLGPLSPAARRIALAGLASPPLFVLAGVAPGLLHSPVREGVIWPTAWVCLGLAASLPSAPEAASASRPNGRLRVAHGVAGAVVALFVAFHLFNHLTGLLGADTHARVMKAGRLIYRSPVGEPVLIGLLLFQVVAGLTLAWRWSGRPVSLARSLQVCSGAYLAAFILTHLNSVLISARAVHHTQTDWAWAAGLPQGLIADAWSIRLLPHYALGVVFVITHLFCGLRDVMLAHRVSAVVADRVWCAGLVGAAALATAIICALCGMRL